MYNYPYSFHPGTIILAIVHTQYVGYNCSGCAVFIFGWLSPVRIQQKIYIRNRQAHLIDLLKIGQFNFAKSAKFIFYLRSLFLKLLRRAN